MECYAVQDKSQSSSYQQRHPISPRERLHTIDPFDVIKTDEIEQYDGDEASNSSAQYAIRTGKPIVEDD